MGEIIVRKVRGMNWKAKISLVLIFTTIFSTFMYQGWYSPRLAQAIAPARVQSATGNGGANTVTTFNLTAFGAAPTAGNTLVAIISTRGTSANRVSSVTSTGASWSFVAQATNTNGTTTEIWYAPNVSAGAGTTITVNLVAALRVAAVAIEYSGILTASAVDQTASATGNSTSASTGTTAATTQGDELWLGGVGLVSSGYTLGTITNGFATVTNASSTNATATNNARVYALERLVNATGTANTGGTVSTSSQWSGAIATFKGQRSVWYLDSWTSLGSGNPTSNTSVSLGSKRLLLVAIISEYAVAPAGTGHSVTCNGRTLTPITWTGAQRATVWLGYLNDADAAVCNGNPLNITYQGTPSASETFYATFENVDQSNPVVDSNANAIATGASITFGKNVNVLTNGAIFYAVSHRTNTNTFTPPAGYTEDFDQSDPTNNFRSGGGTKQIAANGTENATVTTAGTTTTAYALGVVSLRPAPPATLTIADGTAPNAKTVYRGQTAPPSNLAVSEFTLNATGGDVSVSSIVITGSASTPANVAANGVKLWLDNGSTPHEWDAGDSQLGSGVSFSGTTATLPGLGISIPNGTTNTYIVTYDIAPTATATQTLNGYASTVTSDASTTSGSDTADNNLTVGSAALTVGEGTNPASGDAQQGTPNNAVGAFTLSTDVGSAAVSQIVITGTNPAFVTSNGVKLWVDNGTIGSWDGADVQVGSGATFAGTTATISGLAIQATTTAKQYLITYDIDKNATLGQTTTGYISGITSTANTSTNNDNNIDATLTIKAKFTVTSCADCHAYPPTDGTRSGATGAVVGDHDAHVNKVGAVCSVCHVTPATQTSADFAHRDGNIQMQPGATGISGGYYDKNNNSAYNAGVDDTFLQTNNPTTSVCRNISCHGGNNPTPQWGVGTAGCVDCHSTTAITRTKASGSLDPVAGEFGQAWGHKKSGRGTVTNADCIVCHLEGNYTSQATSTYHADGNIDLRDPDGAGETPITNVSGGAFTFQKFSTSYAAGSRTTTGHLSNNVDNVLTQKFCLACHDSNGATNTTARTSGGTAFMPWGGVNLGANYTTANGAATAGGLIDVKTQVGAASQSKHPILGPRSAGYPTTALMIAPYDNFTRTAGTLANSVVLNCFDCHNTPTTPLTSRTVVAHGSNATNHLRGVAATNVTSANLNASTATTLCKVCHDPTTAGRDSHDVGSGFGDNGGQQPMRTFLEFGCNICHGSSYDTIAARPVLAQDSHGYPNSASGPVTTKRAFIRGNTAQGYVTQWSIGSCTGMGGSGSVCGSSRTESYSPGGVY